MSTKITPPYTSQNASVTMYIIHGYYIIWISYKEVADTGKAHA